jgi:hypothetical protein
MYNSTGTLPLDSTSVLGNAGGAFSNTWLRSS